MKPFLRPLLAAAIVLFALQCQDQEGPVAADEASWSALALAATQEQLQQAREIDRLIRDLFKNNEEQAAVNRFCNAANLYVRGNVTTGQKRLFELMNLTQKRYQAGQLECGQSPACRTKLARLFNAENQFFGLAGAGDDPIPPQAFATDGAVQPCGPGGCLVVTGTEFAGVRIPPGAIGENVVVFVHRLPDAAEPLNTSLDQYPLFYFFGTSPEVEFNAEVNVALCVLDNPPFAIGAPPDAELRIAHNVGEGFEVLPLGPSDFIDCTDAAPMAFHTPAWQGFVADALRPFSPSLLYAMPGTLGSRVSSFSPFGAVDVGEGPPPPPPVNGRIAFASNRDGNSEIYVMNADGTGQTRLTNNGAADLLPAWSPDGTKIAFASSPDGNFETFDIYVMNADGTGQTRLTNNAARDIEPAWSPDGTKIAFTSFRDGTAQTYVMNADGTGQTNLTNHVGSDFNPAWSPGTRIAFASTRPPGGVEIWIMNADGTDPTRLTNNSVSDQWPAWSPDGTKIAFTRWPPDQEIYVMNADGTGQTNLTNNAGFDRFPAWSPDGTKIAFDRLHVGGDEIYVMNADGTGQTRLTNNAANDTGPAWSP